MLDDASRYAGGTGREHFDQRSIWVQCFKARSLGESHGLGEIDEARSIDRLIGYEERGDPSQALDGRFREVGGQNCDNVGLPCTEQLCGKAIRVIGENNGLAVWVCTKSIHPTANVGKEVDFRFDLTVDPSDRAIGRRLCKPLSQAHEEPLRLEFEDEFAVKPFACEHASHQTVSDCPIINCPNFVAGAQGRPSSHGAVSDKKETP